MYHFKSKKSHSEDTLGDFLFELLPEKKIRDLTKPAASNVSKGNVITKRRIKRNRTSARGKYLLARRTLSTKLLNMSIQQILSFIDAEIAKLQEAKRLLSDVPNIFPAVSKRGSSKKTKDAPPAEKPKAKRIMSAEGRARIAEAQRKRHAAKKRAAKKSAATKTA